MAKGIGNGAPLGACVTRPEIAETMKNRVHFNTFGGNPISMTQGLATLEVIDAENIQQNARDVGDAPEEPAARTAGAAAADRRSPRHGPDARRRAGPRPQRSKEPANTETADVLELCKERGLLLGKGGLFGNVLRIKPPMCLTADDADFLVDCLDEVIEALSSRS